MTQEAEPTGHRRGDHDGVEVRPRDDAPRRQGARRAAPGRRGAGAVGAPHARRDRRVRQGRGGAAGSRCSSAAPAGRPTWRAPSPRTPPARSSACRSPPAALGGLDSLLSTVQMPPGHAGRDGRGGRGRERRPARRADHRASATRRWRPARGGRAGRPPPEGPGQRRRGAGGGDADGARGRQARGSGSRGARLRRGDRVRGRRRCERGEMVAYPTETFYGLGVDALDELALARLRLLKGRREKAISVLVAGPEMLGRLCARTPPRAAALMRALLARRADPRPARAPRRSRRRCSPRGASPSASRRIPRPRRWSRASGARSPPPAPTAPASRPPRPPSWSTRSSRDAAGSFTAAPRREARRARSSGCAGIGWRYCGAARSNCLRRICAVRDKREDAGMAEIAPFSGLRYDPARAADLARVLCPPYDVIGDGERGALEARDPHNVVRLELPRGEDDARYTGAAALLAAWVKEGVLRADARGAVRLRAAVSLAPGRAAATRGAASSRRCGWSRSSAGSCCRTSTPVGAQGGSAPADARDPARRSRRSSASIATPTEPPAG